MQEFRDGLQQELVAKVNRLWNECDIDTNVEILESLKSKAPGSSNKMWRPTGKSVSEQVRPLVVNKLKTSLKFYQLQLGFQKERTEVSVPWSMTYAVCATMNDRCDEIVAGTNLLH